MKDIQWLIDFSYTLPGRWLILMLIVLGCSFIFYLIGRGNLFFTNERYELGRGVMQFTRFVDKLAFWKALLPVKFQEFLNKYDGTLPKKEYDAYQAEFGREMEVYPRQMLVIYFLIDCIIVLSFLRAVFFFDHHFLGERTGPVYVMIEHIDVAGLINGALATILAVIIARIVESDHSDKQSLLNTNIEKIEKVTGKINTTNTTIHQTTEKLKAEVEKILSSYTALERKDSFEERLLAYKQILEMAKLPDNCLYFMSFSADFGFLRSQNLSVLMEEANENPPHRDNLKKTFNKFNRTINDLNLDLRDICLAKPESTFLAFLDISNDNRSRLSHYQEYINRVLGNETAEVIIWQKPNEPDAEMESRLMAYVDKAKKEDMAFYIDFNGNMQEPDPKDNLLDRIVKKNVDNINELKLTKAQITLLDRMSFQFIMTMPGKRAGVRNRTNQCCVITFSNIDAIGDNAGVYAFQSTDKDTIDNLKKIFETYQKQQVSRNERVKEDLLKWRNFTELFNILPGKKGYNVLKFKNLKEEFNEFLNGVAMADIRAALYVQNMFLKINETVPEIKYPIQTSPDGEETVDAYNEEFFEKDGTYFAIGLFGEDDAPGTLAEYVSKQYPHVCTFVRRKPDTTIDTAQNLLRVNGYEFKPVWTPGGKKDLALIAKFKPSIGERDITVFVIGGINHFGTEQIGRYLANNWQEIHKKAGSKPFFALYDVNLEENVAVSEKHFFHPSLTDSTKWIEKVR